MGLSKVSQGVGAQPYRPFLRLTSGLTRAFCPLLFIVVLAASATAQAPKGPGELRIEDLPGTRPSPARTVVPLDTIVLDPGHGGRDEGVRGPSGLLEKDVTLKLAQHLGALLKARLGIRVIQTRAGDVSLLLSERTSLANHAKAQLFISIHFEGSFRRETEGFRLYTFSPGPPGEGAAREGAEGVEAILWDLAQTAFANESARLAELMAESLERRIGLRRAGIAKAPVFPLRGAQMPAVLVSPAHLSNAREELLLRDEAFLQKVAENLYEAILNFMAGRDVAE